MQKSNSNESDWLFFTECYKDGHRFNVTVRSTTTEDDIARIPAFINGLADELNKAGIQAGRSSSPPMPSGEPVKVEAPTTTKEQDAVNSASSSSPSTDGPYVPPNPFKIVKLTISGTEEKPEVQMWSDNDKLKFSVLRAPTSLVVTELHRAYPGAIEETSAQALGVCGKTIKVDWRVHWTQSPKKESWKDIRVIEIPNKGTPVWRDDESAPTIDRTNDVETDESVPI